RSGLCVAALSETFFSRGAVTSRSITAGGRSYCSEARMALSDADAVTPAAPDGVADALCERAAGAAARSSATATAMRTALARRKTKVCMASGRWGTRTACSWSYAGHDGTVDPVSRRARSAALHHARNRRLAIPDNRQPSHRFPRRGEDRVAHRRCDGWRAGFADPALLLGARHDVHLDRRHLLHAEHGVVVEVSLANASAIDRDVAVERGREPVHDATLHLRFDRIGIDDRTAVHRAYHAVHARHTVTVERDFRHLRHVGPERLGHRDAARAPRRERLAPPRLLRRQLQHPEMTRVVGKQGAAELVRVLPRGARDFVDEAFGEIRIVR